MSMSFGKTRIIVFLLPFARPVQSLSSSRHISARASAASISSTAGRLRVKNQNQSLIVSSSKANRKPIMAAETEANTVTTALPAVRTAVEETGPDGAFRRTDALWRNWITKDGQFPPEADRYHLYVAYACPWAHRTLIVRALKGLQDTISVTIVHPTWQRTNPSDPKDAHAGWVFANPDGAPLTNADGNGGPIPASYPGTGPDTINGAKSIRDVYVKAGDTNGKYSVPVFWDKKLNTIVSNESSEIIAMLNSEFNDFAKNPNLDMNPHDLMEEMNAANEWIYPTINDGVYRCGFATSQAAYNEAIDALTKSLDRVESILSSGQKFITGDRLTLSDIRLFVTLIRFDPVYVVYFKTNTRSIQHSPAMLQYCRRIYQMEGVADTVRVEQIKAHYFTSHPRLNYWSIIPRGIDYDALYSEKIIE